MKKKGVISTKSAASPDALFLRQAYARNRVFLLDGQPLCQPAVLLRGDLTKLAFVAGPLKFPGVQSLVEEQKSIAFPQKRFDPVCSSSAKKEEAVLVGIQIKALCD